MHATQSCDKSEIKSKVWAKVILVNPMIQIYTVLRAKNVDVRHLLYYAAILSSPRDLRHWKWCKLRRCPMRGTISSWFSTLVEHNTFIQVSTTLTLSTRASIRCNGEPERPDFSWPPPTAKCTSNCISTNTMGGAFFQLFSIVYAPSAHRTDNWRSRSANGHICLKLTQCNIYCWTDKGRIDTNFFCIPLSFIDTWNVRGRNIRLITNDELQN